MTTKPTLHELLEQLAERLEANKGKPAFLHPFASAKDTLSGPPAIHPCRIKGMGTNYYGNTVVIR